MYRNILVPMALDHGKDVTIALNVARRFAADGGKITALTVIEPVSSYIAQYLPEGQAEKALAAVKAELKADLEGAGDVTPVVVHGHAGRTIVEYAEAHGADLIVIASHQPGLQDYFLGSTAARVVRRAHCSVLVLR